MSSGLVFLAGVLAFGFAAPLLQDAQPPAASEGSAQPAAAPASAPAPANASAPASAASAAAEQPIPAAFAAEVNPVHPTAASLARAKQIYGYDCEVCHGKGGDGAAEIDMKTKPRDYRDPGSLKPFTDGEIFYIIENGRGAMPGEGPRAKPDEVWNLVIYLRSLSKGKS